MGRCEGWSCGRTARQAAWVCQVFMCARTAHMLAPPVGCSRFTCPCLCQHSPLASMAFSRFTTSSNVGRFAGSRSQQYCGMAWHPKGCGMATTVLWHGMAPAVMSFK